MENKILQLAAEIIGTDVENVKKRHKDIPEIDAHYFWSPLRGGVSVIINSNYESLSAPSFVGYEKHLEAFLNGKRN